MKAPIQWLRDYVNIEMSAADYVRRMVMAGTGVEGIEDLGEGFSGVVVGKVLRCEAHPDSEHLHVCEVDAGGKETLQIVCGAPNVREGVLAPLALEGAKLPNGMTIRRGKIRGVESRGMLCSGAELGVPDGLYPNCGEAGILLFEEDHAPGSDVKPIFGLNERVVDFEILANRPDCLSIWGLARESAAVLDEQCVMPEIRFEEDGEGALSDTARIEVQDTEKCHRYCARVITDVKIDRSPGWMRRYLYAAGVRPINNIVDITNFIMLETGHPMHAFDMDKVNGGQIIVRAAREGESLTTLDGKRHRLDASMLVIADAERATGLAGIMGGEESEITESTRTVLFECAVFDRTSVRLTSRALGIRTESGGRFEKGVCVETAQLALERACMLVNDLGCGRVARGGYDFYPRPADGRVVAASVERINARISTRMTGEQIKGILLRLGIGVTLTGDSLLCEIPSWRGDLAGEADISEEALRLYGYEHIPSTLPMGETMAGFRSESQRLQDRIKQSLAGQGFYEAMGFSFVSPGWASALGLPGGDWRLDGVPIRNPLGEDTSVMRTSLVPTMLQSLATNLNRSNPEVKLFELSSVFQKTKPGKLPREPRVLCAGMYGEKTDFYALKDEIWRMLGRFGIPARAERGGDPYYHPGRKAMIFAGDQRIGQMGEVHPDVAQAFGITERRIYVAELALSAISDAARPIGAMTPLPRFPALVRDLALVTDENVEVGPLMEAVREAAGKRMEDVTFFDIYRSAQLGEGKKSVAFSLTFRAADRTLTEGEVGEAMARVLAACERRFGASLRK